MTLTETVAEMLKKYVAQHPPKSGDAQAVADQLYWHYLENNRMDNDKISVSYATLREKANMPPREYDEVLYIVGDLCIEHGRLAFLEGLKIGMLLMQEVQNW